MEQQAPARRRRSRLKFWTCACNDIHSDRLAAAAAAAAPEPVPADTADDGNTDGIHLVVVVHGLWGCPSQLGTLSSTLLERYSEVPADAEPSSNDDDKRHHRRPLPVQVFATHSNIRTLTYDGLERCGERAALEVETEIARIGRADPARPVRRLSIAGYSLGGLVARYLIGLLYAHGWFTAGPDPAAGDTPRRRRPADVAPVEPCNFTSFASPHIGAAMPQLNRMTSLKTTVFSRVMGPSGPQLFLTDDFCPAAAGKPDKTDASTAGRQPLLAVMADPRSLFHRGLAAFRRRSLYANLIGDRSSPFYTSAISAADPFAYMDWAGSPAGPVLRAPTPPPPGQPGWALRYIPAHAPVLVDLADPFQPYPYPPPEEEATTTTTATTPAPPAMRVRTAPAPRAGPVPPSYQDPTNSLRYVPLLSFLGLMSTVFWPGSAARARRHDRRLLAAGAGSDGDGNGDGDGGKLKKRAGPEARQKRVKAHLDMTGFAASRSLFRRTHTDPAYQPDKPTEKPAEKPADKPSASSSSATTATTTTTTTTTTAATTAATAATATTPAASTTAVDPVLGSAAAAAAAAASPAAHVLRLAPAAVAAAAHLNQLGWDKFGVAVRSTPWSHAALIMRQQVGAPWKPAEEGDGEVKEKEEKEEEKEMEREKEKEKKRKKKTAKKGGLAQALYQQAAVDEFEGLVVMRHWAGWFEP